MPRVLFPLSIVCVCAVALTGAPPAAKAEAKKSHPILSPKAGVKTPGIQIPFETIKPEVELAVETPGFIVIGDSIFVESSSQDAVARIDPKTNKLLDPILGVKKPCAGAMVAFGSLWVPGCGAQTLTRFDPKTSKVTATVSAGVADVPLGLAATTDSVWLLTDSKTTLSRIDPASNSVVGEVRLPVSCNSISFGETSLWITCPSDNRVYRVNPATNLVENRIETSAGPRSVAFLDGSVWVLCDKEGKIDRIDPKTNKVLRSVDLAVPNAGGNLVASGGFLWTTQAGFPLSRIDPMNEKERVAQQFWGEGGGLVSASANAIWLSNPGKGTVMRLDPKRVIATLAE
jgi:glutamine cyclotransferase